MKLKVYLDTSVISSIFDDRNPERKRLTEDFFSYRSHFDIYISEITIAEIEKTRSAELREKMKNFVKPFKILKINNEMETLAVEFIKAGAVPKNSIEDAYHIAIAVIYGMDYLLSWNFRHIVRLKTRDIVRMVISLKEYKPIDIIAPPELI